MINKTQVDCYNDFICLLDDIDIRISEIDKETPWLDYEPKWWLDMMDIQKFSHKYKRRDIMSKYGAILGLIWHSSKPHIF